MLLDRQLLSDLRNLGFGNAPREFFFESEFSRQRTDILIQRSVGLRSVFQIDRRELSITPYLRSQLDYSSSSLTRGLNLTTKCNEFFQKPLSLSKTVKLTLQIESYREFFQKSLSLSSQNRVGS